MTTCSRSEEPSLADDHLARAEIPDVEPGPELLDLLLRQAVEGRIGGVEALHGFVLPQADRSPPGSPGDDIVASSMDVSRRGPDARLRADVLGVEGCDLRLGALLASSFEKAQIPRKAIGMEKMAGLS